MFLPTLFGGYTIARPSRAADRPSFGPARIHITIYTVLRNKLQLKCRYQIENCRNTHTLFNFRHQIENTRTCRCFNEFAVFVLNYFVCFYCLLYSPIAFCFKCIKHACNSKCSITFIYIHLLYVNVIYIYNTHSTHTWN